ncbi:hypothetical protein F2Q68_00031799 [Brassica cretica]|uniref:Uncharacterized protein n=1 Tax=Brassica cretica TaxID=69181 RepID=A0A8S9GIA9_BRACR|nr:hypothetical protein F2Q68_00031799 [Brassica cretica]
MLEERREQATASVLLVRAVHQTEPPLAKHGDEMKAWGLQLPVCHFGSLIHGEQEALPGVKFSFAMKSQKVFDGANFFATATPLGSFAIS